MPSTVHHKLNRFILADGFPHVIDWKRSKDSWFVDATDGQRYLDCYSMHASQPLGWNHPKLATKLAGLPLIETRPCNSDFYSQEYADFVEHMSEVTPDFHKYFFIDTGTLAIENAIKAAFDWKAQKMGWHDEHDGILDVIHLQEAFHGRSGYTLSLTNTGLIKTKWYPQFKWTRILNPKTTSNDVALAEAVSLKQAEQALRNGNVAAIILEPIQGEGGDNHFRKEFFDGLRRLADQYEAMLIIDEVQSGVGITGKMWCYEHFGIIPDMIAFGKKTQICGFCSTKRIDEVATNVFTTSGRINSTWCGSLADMQRCRVFLDIIKEDDLVRNAAKVGRYLMEKMQELSLLNLRGRGLMIAFDFPTVEERNDFYGCLSRKMLCLKCGSKSIRFRPHLSFTEEDADSAVEILKACG